MRTILPFLLVCLFGSTCIRGQIMSVSTKNCTAGCTVQIQCQGEADGPIPRLLKQASGNLFKLLNQSEIKTISVDSSFKSLTSVNGAAFLLPAFNNSKRYELSSESYFLTLTIDNATVEDSGYYGCVVGNNKSPAYPLLVYDLKPELDIKLYDGNMELKRNSNGVTQVSFDSFTDSSLSLSLYGRVPFGSLILNASSLSPKAQSGIDMAESRFFTPEVGTDCQPNSENLLCRYNFTMISQVQWKNIAGLHQVSLQLALLQPNNSYPAWKRVIRFRDASQAAELITRAGISCSNQQQTVAYGSVVELGCSVPASWLSVPGFQAYWRIRHALEFNPRQAVTCAYSNIQGQMAASNGIMNASAMLDMEANSCHNELYSKLYSTFVARAEPESDQVRLLIRVPFAVLLLNGRTMSLGITANKEFIPDGPLSTDFSVTVESAAKSGNRLIIGSSALALLLLPVLLQSLN